MSLAGAGARHGSPSFRGANCEARCDVPCMLCRSDEHGQAALGNLEGQSDLQKLDRETFSRAPREVMEGTLASIR